MINAIYFSTDEGKKYTYADVEWHNAVVEGIIQFFSYFLLLNTMVPISLIVSLEIIKFIQAFYVNWDIDMFVDEVGKGANFKSTSINEELGMVDYIFTDKTGTLTWNIMEFKAFLVGNELYGHMEEEKGHRWSTI